MARECIGMLGAFSDNLICGSQVIREYIKLVSDSVFKVRIAALEGLPRVRRTSDLNDLSPS
jgi:hypothetical protein